jgi:DNA repair protein RecO (recombination protein O)
VTLGVLLRTTPYGEADLIVSLLTQEHGKISALARGARRSRKRFGGSLGPLLVCRFALRPRGRGELFTLESAEVVHDYTALAADVGAYAHASYAIELVRELCPAEVPEPEVLELTIALHDSLKAVGPRPAALRAFELGLLEALGSAPQLDACVGCGIADDTLDAPGTVFDPARGGAVCPRCAAASRGPSVRPLPGPARAYLLAARAAGSPQDAAALDDDADEAARIDHGQARDAMVAMLIHLLGRPLKTLEFIGKVQAASRREP